MVGGIGRRAAPGEERQSDGEQSDEHCDGAAGMVHKGPLGRVAKGVAFTRFEVIRFGLGGGDYRRGDYLDAATPCWFDETLAKERGAEAESAKARDRLIYGCPIHTVT